MPDPNPQRRALIVAVERYAQMQGALAGELAGTHDSAQAFRRWAVEEQGVPEENVVFCTESATVPGRTSGATRGEVRKELVNLRKAGGDKTEHFYCYLAGHGFRYTGVDDVKLADVLLLEDYTDVDDAAETSFMIDPLRTWLAGNLGPGEHFYFVDCCRNAIRQQDIRAGDLNLPRRVKTNGEAAVHSLYSTIEGDVAAVGSGFSGVLVDGLKGRGRAKVWLDDGSGMAVTFRPVTDYVRRRLVSQPVDGQSYGPDRDGLIRELKPAPCYTAEIIVEGAADDDRFEVDIRTVRNQPLPAESFTGSRGEFAIWPPDAYVIRLTAPGSVVEALDTQPAELYDDCTLRFRKRVALGAVPAPDEEPPAGSALTVRGPANARVRILGSAGLEVEGEGDFTTELVPDRYSVEVTDRRGVRVRRREIELRAAEPREIDLQAFGESPLRRSLLARLPHHDGAVDFSETLGGATPDHGLDLWLATIGGARVLQRDPSEFSKLGPLPLASFLDARAGDAPLYLLAGFDDAPERISVAVEDQHHALEPHPELPGLFELVASQIAPDGHLVTVQVGDLAPMTLATATTAGHVTLVVLARQADEAIRIRQLILPLPLLVGGWPRELSLPVVRRTVEIQRQFERRRELEKFVEREELERLEAGNWPEPICCLMAAYELVRRGRPVLGPMRDTLSARFPELLPDVLALRQLTAGDQAPAPPPGPPLILDGLLAFDLDTLDLPLPAAALDYRGPWTLWRGSG